MSTESNSDYLASGQYQRLATFAIAAIGTAAQIDFSEEIFSVFMGAIELIFSLIAAALFGVLGYIFTVGTRPFLFFRPPDQIPQLTTLWMDVLPIFWAVLPVAGAAFFFGMQLFPEKEEADIYRFMERALVAVIALVVTAPVLPTPDIFSLSVVAVNEIGLVLFPESYSLTFMQSSMNSLMGGLAAGLGLGATIIGIVFMSYGFVIGLLLIVASFYLTLSLRMLLVYTVYAMMPMLLALWVVDIGPMKYAKMVTALVFKLTAVLLLLGIILSGVLATSQAIADPGDGSLGFADQDVPSGYVNDNGLVSEDGEINEVGLNEVSSKSSEPPAGWQMVMLQMFVWAGGLVLCTALTTSVMGMVISMPSASSVSTGSGKKSSDGGAKGPQGKGGGARVTQSSDGAVHVGSEQGGGITMDESGATSFEPSNPSPDNPEGVPLREKADHMSGGRLSDMEESMGGWKQDKVNNADEQAESAYEAGEEAKENMTEAGAKKGKEVGEAVDEKVGGDGRAAAAGEKVGAYVGRAGGHMKSAKAKLADAGYVKKKLYKGMNLGKRGGSAYASVFKQPDVGSSLGEMGRIARESPIGKPNGPVEQSGGDSEGMSEATGSESVVPTGEAEPMDAEPGFDEYDTSGHQAYPHSSQQLSTASEKTTPTSVDPVSQLRHTGSTGSGVSDETSNDLFGEDEVQDFDDFDTGNSSGTTSNDSPQTLDELLSIDESDRTTGGNSKGDDDGDTYTLL
jgi:hypothetical protein